MKSLYEYIVTEGLRDTIKKLVAKFKHTEEEDVKKNYKSMEDARLALYQMIHDQSSVCSVAEVAKLVSIRMRFKDGGYLTGYPNVDDDDVRAIFQAMLDFGYMNYRNQVDNDPYGENICDRAYYECMEETNNREKALKLFSRYCYGWSYAKALDIRVSREWKVLWNADSWNNTKTR